MVDAVIDWDRVRELQEELGEDEFTPVLELFFDELEEVAMRLRGRSCAQLEADLHFLKGSALNLGLKSFAALCSQGEKESHDGQQIDLGCLLTSYSEAKRALIAGLNPPPCAAGVA